MRKFSAVVLTDEKEGAVDVMSNSTTDEVKLSLISRYGKRFVSLADPVVSDQEMVLIYASNIMAAKDRMERNKILSEICISFQAAVQEEVKKQWESRSA